MKVQETILIIDFGSQYTQLIARRLRELNIYNEIHPFFHIPSHVSGLSGVILSGSPCSVNQENAPDIDISPYIGKVPILGICYGAQWLTKNGGGRVEASQTREYGRASLDILDHGSPIFQNLSQHSQVWMSHADTIREIPNNFEVIASTGSIPVAAFQIKNEPIYGLQFHPEVTHSEQGIDILKNFALNICQCHQNWTPAHFIDSTVHELKEKLSNDQVIIGLSGGVDSTVAAVLLHKAIGDQLTGIFVDNGLLRKGEFEMVLENYRRLGLKVKGVDASSEFYQALAGIEEPEAKRKAIGRVFIEVFEKEAFSLENVKWLAQGTIYPDVIESVSVNGPSATIKSHHNVGGLPDKMNLKIVEPLRMLFKDEVRRTGQALGIPSDLINRHPFPGPGLGIRILGNITPEKVRILQEADAIFIHALHQEGFYSEVWQAGAIFLPVKSVGVMGDERTYENVIALRAVTSLDGMTADWAQLPWDFWAKVSNEIINQVKGINRVVLDISSKPPATIEWE